MRIIFFPVLIAAAISCNSNSTQEKISATVPADSPIVTPANDSTINISPAPATDAAKLIVAGKSIGLTAIDEKAESINAKLGPADEGDAAMGKAIGTWYSKNNKAHSTTIYFTTNFGDKEEAKRVSQVRVTSPYFSTEKNIMVGSSFDAVKQAFPDAKESGSYTSKKDTKAIVKVFDDVKSGIAFEFGTDNICSGITVHKPGEKAFETYLAFFDDYKPVENK